MSYCDRHRTNNCIECAIEQQTKEIIAAIERLSKQQENKIPLIKRSVFDFIFNRNK